MIDWQSSGPAPGQEYTDIRYEAAEGISKITINRPEVRNAFRPTGDATLLYYLSEDAQEGRDACVQRRAPDFARFPRRP